MRQLLERLFFQFGRRELLSYYYIEIGKAAGVSAEEGRTIWYEWLDYRKETD